MHAQCPEDRYVSTHQSRRDTTELGSDFGWARDSFSDLAIGAAATGESVKPSNRLHSSPYVFDLRSSELIPAYEVRLIVELSVDLTPLPTYARDPLFRQESKKEKNKKLTPLHSKTVTKLQNTTAPPPPAPSPHSAPSSVFSRSWSLIASESNGAQDGDGSKTVNSCVCTSAL
jgi:hypothetical protein